MYTKEQYDKDTEFIRKMDSFVTRRIEFIAYFFVLAACLAAHILYITLFAAAGVRAMVIFNVFSIAFYVLMIILVNWVKDKLSLIYASIAEIIIHASAATICVGCTPDFMMFLLMLVTLSFLIPNKNRNAPFVVMWTSLILYGLLKYFYRDTDFAAYPMANKSFSTIFYIINFFAGSFVLVYTTSIYSLMIRYKECKLRVQTEQLRIMASVDPLTNLSNRRAMTKTLDEIRQKCTDTDSRYVIGLGDIDNFKRVNDTYGHDFGDIVLSKVAEVITEAMPPNGCAARWGGEEFLFIIPDSDINSGRQYAEKIIQTIEKAEFTHNETKFHVTMTFGVCEGTKNDIIDKIISCADKRLYKGKHNGKNMVVYK